ATTTIAPLPTVLPQAWLSFRAPLRSTQTGMLTRRTSCDPCAHAASGDAAAAPPRRPMNSRRFTDTPRLKQQMVSTLTCTEEGVGDVRFGSQADICSAKRHVRFNLKSSQRAARLW